VKKSLSAIAGFGLLGAFFMALMSMFYLQQIPNKADIDRLRTDLKQEHGMILAAKAPLQVELVRTKKQGSRIGLRVVCALRPAVRRQKASVDTMLDQIGESVLQHADWKGRIRFVEVVHSASPQQHRVVRPEPKVMPKAMPQAAAPGSLVGEAPPKR
jgi:hypothetical protein